MYLEKHFNKITDIFERSIVTYAFHLVNSPMKDIAMQQLNKTKRKNDFGVYWSNWEIPKMRIYWPSKNPRYDWKPESNNEAYAVAATSYALLTHILRAEKTNKFEIMTWLQTQRNHIGGMGSTYDTLLAHKALTMYSISTGDSIQSYNMHIKLSSSSSADHTVSDFFINDTNLRELQEYDVQNVWGNLAVDGEGTGYALVQLKQTFNVEYPWLIRKAPYEAFKMDVKTKLYGRNFSHIGVDVCLSWLPENLKILNANRSGHVEFSMQLPTGYIVEERYLKSLIGDPVNYGDGENIPGPGVNFLLEYLDVTPTCFTFAMTRYIPVANLSRYYEMKIYEYNEPNNAVRSMYHLKDIFGLDICEVCGSYQCPYCPYYAFASKVNQNHPIFIFMSLLFSIQFLL